MMNLKFYTTEDNRWYVDLPEWDGSLDELEMVAGADVLLDIIDMNYFNSIGIVYLKVTDDPRELDNDKVLYVLNKQNSDIESGAIYNVNGNHITPFDIWLCDVTKFVFNEEFPNIIFFEI